MQAEETLADLKGIISKALLIRTSRLFQLEVGEGCSSKSSLPTATAFAGVSLQIYHFGSGLF